MRRACPDCSAEVIRARTEAMSWQLLNRAPDPAGNVHAYSDGRGNWYARTVAPGTPAVAPDVLMMPHYATSPKCREAAVKRREARSRPITPPAAPAELPANVTQISTWKAAVSGRKAALRRRRGSR
jgi:hypothetical protein